ncbi:MAG: 2Fe-2S iron-sulfur cluster binding domain-containing protein [Proteobacteria bacterium]|nr:2Fe-2S iron-sulfur cluster binding domain-containing protein [Pseudomonadota bacterium]
MYKVIFINKDLTETEAVAEEGQSILEVAEENGISLKGACGGNVACGTCHVIVDEKWFDIVEKTCPASEKEDDVLDHVPELTQNSRLACCIKMRKELDGVRLAIPERNRNI